MARVQPHEVEHRTIGQSGLPSPGGFNRRGFLAAAGAVAVGSRVALAQALEAVDLTDQTFASSKDKAHCSKRKTAVVQWLRSISEARQSHADGPLRVKV